MTRYTTKNKRDFIVRKPDEDDALKIIEYSKALFESTDQVLTVVEEFTMTVETEKAWLGDLNNSPNSFIQIAEAGDQIIGMLFFAGQKKIKTAHTGEFGLSVHADWQGMGIGRILVLELLNWAENNDRIEKIVLQVFSTNIKAIALYQSLGFIEEGRYLKAIKQPGGGYVDVIQMYRFTKSNR